MRIGIISTIHVAPWGGSEALWAAMAETALRQGHEVAVSAPSWPVLPERLQALRQLGAKLFLRPRQNLWDMVDRGLRFAGKRLALDRPRASLWRRTSGFGPLFRFAPDVLCISQSANYDFLYRDDLIHLVERSGTPYVLVCHSITDTGPLPEGPRQKALEFFRRASRVGFVANRGIEITERQLAHVFKNAVVLRNPVNMTAIDTVPWPEVLPVRMACVGSLGAMAKGQDILLAVLGSDTWRARDWRLSFCGTGPDQTYLEALARFYDVQERVHFAGQVGDIRRLWAGHHLLVMPSRIEMAPLVLVEAMLCGRPSVVTDVGGITEWVDEPTTAFIAEAATPRAFARALDRAWQAFDHWREIGLHAHDAAMSKHDPYAGETLLGILEQVASEPSNPARA